MSLLSIFRPKTPLTLSQQLDQIGYFNRVTDPVKWKKIIKGTKNEVEECE